ncbi:uncharacterized protein BX664DRAFT_340336 [Halteromyces radiatus]|uniref:uncharacterized protein n=1 Tax=Halteromyces radiatus TaxID=101107 RepID=UPI00221EDDDD|nr:uncharacterized protein BX664DRAFT_340336 [Halteromyces radiatus]KAI8081411.1 hypothetical protein BX664DRAFT_340336 [Halteromyces radiatus]
MNNKMDLDAPRAAWLFKMSQTSFGRLKWAPRYFILLDTELRYYRDEHTETPSQVLHLSDVGQIIPLMDRPNTFRLEPSLRQSTGTIKPWTIECSSHHEMELWYKSIQHRLSLAPVFSPPSFLPNKRLSHSHHFFKKALKPSSSTPIMPSHISYIPVPSLSQQRRGVIIPYSSSSPEPEPSTSLHPLDLPSSSKTSTPYFSFS